jgi:PAS domain S-box-containing protein
MPPDLDHIRAILARIPDPLAVLERLFAFAPVGFQIYEASGRSILVNQAFIELFGSEPPPEYNVLRDEIAAKQGVLDLIRRAFQGETIQVPPIWYDPRELTQVKVEKGNRAAISATFFPLHDVEEKVTHVAIVFRDMTAEMVHREQLEQERELLAAIVDQVSEGIIMTDANGTLRLVNRTAQKMGVRTGTAMEAWARAGLRDAEGRKIPPEQMPLARALRGDTARAVVQHRAPDGTLRALTAAAVPLRRSDGSLRGAVLTFRDETERVHQDAAQQQAAHFRERFIGILGHDLRSPLSAIMAGAGTILRQREAPDRLLAAAARISSSGERMARMISDLLDFTQARLGGGIAVQRKQTDLGEVGRAVVEEIAAGNPARAIALQIEGDVTGSFDPDRVAQLLSNLLANAVTYAPPDDRIGVRVARNESGAEIEVDNGGPPIADEDRARLFDPFRRGTLSQNSRGLGLGLFIVQQIARAHGGDVQLETRDGRTVFRTTLQR